MGQLQDFVDKLVSSVTGAFKFDVEPDLSEKENVEKLISETAMVAGLIGMLQPFPMADFFLLAPLHAKMTLQIGKIKGYEISEERAVDVVKEVAAAAGTVLVVQGLIATIGKISPFTRVLLGFPILYAGTWALGIVTDYYFDCMASGRTPEAEVMKDLFAEQFKVGKKRGQSFDQSDMKARADALRAKVAARDPKLTTETRLEPRPQRKSMGQSVGTVSSDPSPSRFSIKIKKKGDESDESDESDPPLPAAADAPTPEGTPTVKTIGPEGANEDVEIGFKPAKKTLGEAPAPAVVDERPPEPEPEPTPEPEAAVTTDAGSLIDQLERLGELLEAGILTSEEFQKAKEKLLADA